jgi:hypothetical protein
MTNKVADAAMQYLMNEGWQRYKSTFSDIWCKRWKDAPRCKCNIEKEGIQVVVTISVWDTSANYEIDVTGEKPDGVWVKLCAYGLDAASIQDTLNVQADKLIAAWTALVTT